MEFTINQIQDLFKSITGEQPKSVVPVSLIGETGNDFFGQMKYLGEKLTDLRLVRNRTGVYHPVINLTVHDVTGSFSADEIVTTNAAATGKVISYDGTTDLKVYVLTGSFEGATGVTGAGGGSADVADLVPQQLIKSGEMFADQSGVFSARFRSMADPSQYSTFAVVIDSVTGPITSDVLLSVGEASVEGFLSDVASVPDAESKIRRNVFFGDLVLSNAGNDNSSEMLLTLYSFSGTNENLYKKALNLQFKSNKSGAAACRSVMASAFDYQPVGSDRTEVSQMSIQLNGYLISY